MWFAFSNFFDIKKESSESGASVLMASSFGGGREEA
jgi:hypothetical protein